MHTHCKVYEEVNEQKERSRERAGAREGLQCLGLC